MADTATLSHGQTRERLLQAAAEVFAEKGYRSATVRDICERAGANIAAVNYHFGDKYSLYRELILSYPQRSFADRPVDSWRREGMSAEELLLGFVHDFLTRLLSPEKPAWHSILMVREMVDATDVLDAMVEAFIRPQVESLGRVVTEVAGRPLDPATRGQCVESIVAQIVFHITAQAVIKRLRPERAYDAAELRRLAEHIARFSAAGIRAVAENARVGGKP